jgi:hypothetical protein
MADFWDTFAGVGQALGGIPEGIDKGLAPFKTWEQIDTLSQANQAAALKNRNADLEQQYRESAPNYYGDFTQKAQTGFQADTAKNQYNTADFQNQLAFRNSLLTPEVQQELSKYTPGSPEWMAVYGRAMGATNPEAVLAFNKDTYLPAQARGGGQQISADYLRAAAANMVNPATGEKYGPGVQVQFDPSGAISVTAPDGTPIDMGPNALTIAQQWAGNTAPYTAFNQRRTDERTQQVANVKMVNDTITAMQGKAGTDSIATNFVNLAKQAADQLKANDTARTKLDSQYFDDPNEKQRRLDALDKEDQDLKRQIVYYQGLVEQRGASRMPFGGAGGGGYGGGGGYAAAGPGGYPVGPGGAPGGVRGAMIRGAAGGPAAVQWVNGKPVPVGTPGATSVPNRGAPAAAPAAAAPGTSAEVIAGPNMSLAETESPYGYLEPYQPPFANLLPQRSTRGGGGAGYLPPASYGWMWTGG